MTKGTPRGSPATGSEGFRTCSRGAKLKSHLGLDEIVLVSTCNRVEIYGTTRRAITDGKSLSRLLCSETEDLTPQVCLYKGVAAARHLLRVTASLDSMVLGETEITGQITNAYEIARAGGLTGRVLHRLFQKAFQATKEIRTRTEIVAASSQSRARRWNWWEEFLKTTSRVEQSWSSAQARW